MANKIWYSAATIGSILTDHSGKPTEPIKPDDSSDWELVSAVLYSTPYYGEQMIWYWKCCVE